MADLVVRLDDDLHARFKAKMALEKRSMQSAVHQFILSEVGDFGKKAVKTK
jgi:plasmid stability protein